MVSPTWISNTGMTLVTSAQEVTLNLDGGMVKGTSFNNFLDAIDGSYRTFEGVMTQRKTAFTQTHMKVDMKVMKHAELRNPPM